MKNLKLEHFGGDVQKACEHADALVAAQRAQIPDIARLHPDRVYPDQPLLDEFYFSWAKGCETTNSGKWTQEYKMHCKLNDKNLQTIKDAGVKSDQLGMPTPNIVDYVKVKQEFKSVEELEKELKEVGTMFQLPHGRLKIECVSSPYCSQGAIQIVTRLNSTGMR